MSRLEQLTPGAPVRGLVAGTVAKVVQVEWFGDQAVKVTFEEPGGGVRNRLVYRNDEASFELAGSGRAWSFGADGYLFRLASEARHIRLAYLFDPYLALSTSLIEPLPHQITAVHGEMLPRQPFRFLLADDPGAGKTIMAAPQAELGRLLFDGAAEADPHASVVWRQWPPPEPNHYDVPDQPGRLCRLGSLCVSTCMQLAGLTAGHAPRPAIARARQRHFGGAVDAW